jgi:hypothetical protein
MKTRIIEMIGVLATVWYLALTGCDMGNTPDAQPRGAKGTVRVFVNTDTENPAQATGRTVVPEYPGFAYTLNFNMEGKPGVTMAFNGNVGEVLLGAGTWTLIAIGEKYGEMVAESDPISVIVSAEGDPMTISVTVHPALDGATETFCYAINADYDLTEVAAVLTPRNVGNAAQSEIVLDIEAGVHTVSVAPGYYRLTVRAMKGSQPITRREVIHIYSSIETYKSYALTEADFASAIALGVTLTNGFAGYSPTAIAFYEDAQYGVAIDESAVTGGAWNMEVEGTLGTVYFKVKLEKDGAEYYK